MSARTGVSADLAPRSATARNGDHSADGDSALPRLAFLGAGWIGRRRMRAVAEAACAEIAVIADPNPDARAACAEIAAAADHAESIDALLAGAPLDGIVIATPNALHAEQAMRALDAGLAVYCQKPLARTAPETRRVVEVARSADRLLDVDFCYRHTGAARALKDQIDSGALGDVFAADLTFHNAYGPDGSWYYRPELSGGGCLMDLGIHLVDLAFWLFGDSVPCRVSGHLFSGGARCDRREVEDYAAAELEFEGGGVARIACSWRLSAGQDAVIEAAVYGTDGGARLRNVNGSFFDFVAERLDRRSRTVLAEPPDDWEPRGIVGWSRRLAAGRGYDPRVEHACAVARALDAVYESCTSC